MRIMNGLFLKMGAIVALFAAVAQGCVGDDENMWFYNKCGEEVELYMATFGVDAGVLISPEIVFDDKIPAVRVRENGSYRIDMRLAPYDALKSGKETMQFLVFRKSTLERYSQEELVEGDIFDQRYVLTYDEMKKIGYGIVYLGK